MGLGSRGQSRKPVTIGGVRRGAFQVQIKGVTKQYRGMGVIAQVFNLLCFRLQLVCFLQAAAVLTSSCFPYILPRSPRREHQRQP